MRSAQRVFKNTVALALSTGMERLFTFGLTVYIARALGADAVGQFSIVWSLLMIFQTVSCLGQDQIMVREVARSRSEAGMFLTNGSVIALGGGVLGTLTMLVTAQVLGYDAKVLSYTYVAGLSLIPGSLAMVGEAVIQGLEQMQYVTLGRTASGLVKLGLTIPLLYFGVGLWSVFLVIALANLVLYLLYLWVLRRSMRLQGFRLNRQLAWYIVRMAGTFVVISLFGVVFKQVDILMLGKLRDTATVGIYSTAYRLVRVGMQFMPALMIALFPVMSEVYVRTPDQLGSIARRVIKLLLTLFIPLAVVTTVLADRIILLLYGPGYEGSVLVLRMLVWMLVLFAVNAVLFRTMLASDNERVTMRIAGINMVSSVVLNLLLIPRWGAYGVAIASLCTALIAVLQNYTYIARRLFKLDWFRLVAKQVVAGALCGVVLIALRNAPLLLALLAGLAVYASLVLGLRVFSQEEFSSVRHAWTDAIGRIT